VSVRREWTSKRAGAVVIGLAVVASGYATAEAVTTGNAVSDITANDLPANEKHRPGWRLVHDEKFSKPWTAQDRRAQWIREDYSEQISHMDDDGELFHIHGGPAFEAALASFDQYRKSYALGKDGWLTMELLTRDGDKDGELGDSTADGESEWDIGVPALERKIIPGVGPVAQILVPTHTDGAILRSTDPLPPEYRVEYKLKTMDFGGERNGTLDYDGKHNGYRPDGGCKTTFPWQEGFWQNQWDSTEPPPYCDFGRDVRTNSNGFYFLSISDHADPAPMNNRGRHIHRKVSIEAFNHERPNVGDVCNPATGEFFPYEESTKNAANVNFLGDVNNNGNGTATFGNSECTGERPVNRGGIGTVELQPELMPNEDYRFAIERSSTGFTLEVSGNFRFAGQQTYRYYSDFISEDEDRDAIWHYNQTAEEYDGQFNRTLALSGEYGSFEWDTWPAGSAYPEHFYLGIPHTNFYEGSASIDDVRLYVPAD
jgi:hypothetical protein